MEKIAHNIFLDKYKAVGRYDFYRFLLTSGISKLVRIKNEDYAGSSPEIEYLQYSNDLLFLYRRENDEAFIEMSRIFRKAGHKIYWLMLKKNLTGRNAKFLNLVG